MRDKYHWLVKRFAGMVSLFPCHGQAPITPRDFPCMILYECSERCPGGCPEGLLPF